MLNRGMLSSNTAEWETPQDLFDLLNAEFNFDLDPCATPENAKCSRFFTQEDDGLAQEWTGTVFMNPPYGDPEYPCKPNCKKKRCQKRGYHISEYEPGIADWVRKAYHESRKGTTVVCLLPARTDTCWWWDYVLKAHAVRFLKGRLRFECEGAKHSAPFPSAIVIFQGAFPPCGSPRVVWWDRQAGVLRVSETCPASQYCTSPSMRETPPNAPRIEKEPPRTFEGGSCVI